MIADETDLDALFKRLHLANARRVWRDLVQRAERESWSYRDFLTLLATEEIAHRQQTRLARLTRRAHFPFLKTIDDFNFTYQSSLRLHMLGSALAPDFVTEGRTLIFSGKPGRGKTHLAIAIAYRAIQNGFDAFFTTAAALIDDLSAAFRAGELAHGLPTYTHPAVLVVDEVGYLTYGTDAANMLFHVVNERHRRHRPMIVTTNKSLKAWGRVLHDEDLAQAIIDRVLERGRLLRLDGPSVRTLHVNLDEAMKEDSDQQADLARISGKTRPEFPEPTPERADDQQSQRFRFHQRPRPTAGVTRAGDDVNRALLQVERISHRCTLTTLVLDHLQRPLALGPRACPRSDSATLACMPSVKRSAVLRTSRPAFATASCVPASPRCSGARTPPPR